MRRAMTGWLAGVVLIAAAPAAGLAPRVTHVSTTPPRLIALPMAVHGRAVRDGGGIVRQWPGGYMETAVRGGGVLVRVGAGEVALHVLVDGQAVDTLVKPAPGLYRIGGLSDARHVVRVEVASESQAAPTGFGPFYAEPGTVAAPLPRRARQIEFVGDSHTVGYGVTSPTRTCSEADVWATTDTSRGFGAMLARRYGADYQVNAISGRGVVRNYNGFAAPKLPEAYPYVLFDRATQASEPEWHPQVIVAALGTNDFSTPLHAGERWATRVALHADYEATYLRFLRTLRARDPDALIVLWATDLADGEIAAEEGKVVAAMRAAGDRRIVFVPVTGLAFGGCNAHPSLADQRIIADPIGAAIAANRPGWR